MSNLERGLVVILSVHIADVGVRAVRSVLRACPRPGATPGLRYAETTLTGAIAAGPPKVCPGRAALLASWDDDAALDRFLADDPLAGLLSDGWQVRLQPLRFSGSWGPMPVEIGPGAARDQEDGPVAVLTLGRLRLRRALSFLRANSRAAGRAAADPSMTASVALARPPRFVGTFSLWQSAAAMQRYAYGAAQPEHKEVIRDHRTKPFHHEAGFLRCRPYAAQGRLDGREPVAEAAKVPRIC
ncbi:spheroidene monooxygenase [Streptomyces sp. NPDC058773]|uniref:spheroidene monooxygenase n=1 Tax=Streptomyces sp. NPDC058773 TaxID=3346632 RepID=UPI0036C240F0